MRVFEVRIQRSALIRWAGTNGGARSAGVPLIGWLSRWGHSVPDFQFHHLCRKLSSTI